MAELGALKNGMAFVDSVVTLVLHALLAPVHWLSVLVLVPTTVGGGHACSRVDVGVDGAAASGIGVLPHLLEHPVPRNDFPGVGGQQLQQVELLAGVRDRTFVPA